MHGLFVDYMIHVSTRDNLRDKFISEYQKDFDTTFEDVVSLFLGMEIEHNKRDLTRGLHSGDISRVQGSGHNVP